MRLGSLVQKEFRQFRRDRRMLMMTVIAPLLQLTLLGYAVNLDVRDVPTAVCDEDLTVESQRLVSEIWHSRYFEITRGTARYSDLVPLLDRGRAQLGLYIPRGFDQDLRRGKASVQLIIDGTDSNSAGIGAGYLAGIIAQHGARAQAAELRRRGGAPRLLPRLDLRPRVLYNPTLESVYYMVPGVLGNVLLVVMGTLSSLAIVKEREAGTLEQIMVTPVRAWEIILGKMIPYSLVASGDLFLVLMVILFWFRVPLRGSFLFLLVSAFLFLLTCFAVGLLVSTVSRTQQQAQMTMFFVMMPSTLLAGFFFPIANMPHWMQPLTYAIPLRYFLTIIRAVMLKGSGPGDLWPEVLALLAFAVGLFALGSLAFRKRLQ